MRYLRGISKGFRRDFGGGLNFAHWAGPRPQGTDTTALLCANYTEVQLRYPDPEFLTPVGFNTKEFPPSRMRNSGS